MMNVQMPPQLARSETGVVSAPSGGVGRVPVAVQHTAAADVTSQSQKKPASEEIQQALETLKRVVQPVAQNLQFSVDESSGDTVIRVVDSSTNELIRQIPSEELLNLAKELDKLSGLLFKQKA